LSKIHQLILLTQGPIREILTKIAQLLVVLEKLSIFEMAILIFLLHSYSNQSQINGVAWMGLIFDDYPGFQLKITHAN
jgi:hypothetical protein